MVVCIVLSCSGRDNVVPANNVKSGAGSTCRASLMAAITASGSRRIVVGYDCVPVRVVVWVARSSPDLSML